MPNPKQMSVQITLQDIDLEVKLSDVTAADEFVVTKIYLPSDPKQTNIKEILDPDLVSEYVCEVLEEEFTEEEDEEE